MIEVTAVGGYNEVGRNMTAVKVDDEIVRFDMGLYLPAIVGYEDSEQEKLSEEDLRRIKAIPDDSVLYHERDKVKAIILGHGHLDHIGAVVHVAKKYKNAKIIGTPYTIRVLDSIIKDKGKKLHNEFKSLNIGNSLKISKNLKIEFFNMTHSIPQTALSVLHTKYGKVAYSLDFKLDNSPVLGNKPSYETLGKLENVRLLFLDSLYSKENSKTPSEKVAYAQKIRKKLKQIDREGAEKYLIVCTGNQAEPGSTLTKIANDTFKFRFKKDDYVIFSCKTIPTEENIKNRRKLEEKLNKLGCQLFLDIHVSGHGFKEDERELIKLIKPEHLIPGHGGRSVTSPAKELWLELGYKEDKIHILNDGQK